MYRINKSLNIDSESIVKNGALILRALYEGIEGFLFLMETRHTQAGIRQPQVSKIKYLCLRTIFYALSVCHG